jgi:hypothetical protein
VADDVVLVAGDPVILGDVTGELGGGVEQAVVPGLLRAVAGVLDADGEVVAAAAVP